jgi:hypothetical protein
MYVWINRSEGLREGGEEGGGEEKEKERFNHEVTSLHQ